MGICNGDGRVKTAKKLEPLLCRRVDMIKRKKGRGIDCDFKAFTK
jgi:hypothetical protein